MQKQHSKLNTCACNTINDYRMEPSKVKKMTFTQATVFKTIPRFIETATNDIPLPTQPLVFV